MAGSNGTATRRSLLDYALSFIRPTKVAPTATAGTGGTVYLGGQLQSDEVNQRLAGRSRYKFFANMAANATIVATAVRYYLTLLTKPEWTFEAANDSPEAKAAAAFVTECLHDMTTPWYRVVRRLGMTRFHGFSVQEWTAKRRPDGKIGFLDIEQRPQKTIERWDVDESGTVNGIVQLSPQTSTEIYLPRQKCVYHVDDSLTDSPEGLGIYRQAAAEWERLDQYQQLESRGFENDINGMPLVGAPLTELIKAVRANQLKQEDVDTLLRPLSDLIENHVKSPTRGVMLDSDLYRGKDDAQSPSGGRKWFVEILKSSIESEVAIGRAIDRVNVALARLFGVENLIVGTNGSGSLALAQDKSTNFAEVVDSGNAEIAFVVREDVCRRLLQLNGIDESLTPKPRVEKVQWRDVMQLSGVLVDLANAGDPLTAGDPAAAKLRDLAGLPQRPRELIEQIEASLLAARRGKLRQSGPAGGGDDTAPPSGGSENTEGGDVLPQSGEQKAKGGDESVAKTFDPGQPRDDEGQWTDGGGHSGSAKGESQIAGGIGRRSKDTQSKIDSLSESIRNAANAKKTGELERAMQHVLDAEELLAVIADRAGVSDDVFLRAKDAIERLKRG